MKKTLSMLLVLCLALSLGCAAFASGDPSGEGPGGAASAAIVVTDGKAAVDEEYAAEHGLDVSFDSLTDTEVNGLKLDTGDMLVSGVSVSGDASEFTINDADIHLGVNEETAYVASSTTAGSGALVSSGTLFINDSRIVVDGGANGAEGGHYAVKASGTGTLVVNGSEMIQTGRAGANGLTDDSPEPGSNNGLLIVGFARSSMSVGASRTYYYNSYVETEGWAAMSTDSASGSGLDFYSYNSEAYAVSGGYGIYADSSCRDWLYATTLRGAEHGVIISNNGAVHVYSGASATADDALKYYPADGELTNAGSLIEAGRNCFYIHSPGKLSAFGQQAVVEVQDSTLRTSEELNDQQTLRDYAEHYSQGVADYLDFIRGSLILVKSHSAKIDLTNVACDSCTDTILMTALNADSSSRYLALEKEDTPTVLTMTDMDAAGDVKNYDYQRGVEITLDNTNWSGASLVWEAEEWNAFWDYADGMDSVYWANLDPETYNTDHHGTALTLQNGSVWTVTGESKLDSLVIGADCAVVCDTASVDGVSVSLEAGKTYTGDIVLTGAAASDESSGEASSAGSAAELSDGGWPLSGSGDTSMDAFKSYLKAYMDCVPEMDGHEEELYGLIDAESWEAPVAMAWEDWFEENAMTYEEFVAADGVYSLHLFGVTSPADGDPT